MIDNALCVICSRQLNEVMVEHHHLIPRTFKGKVTIPLHRICHAKIHATFSERELANYYHTPERILESDEIQRFIKWVSNKPTDYYSKNDETKSRKSKRR